MLSELRKKLREVLLTCSDWHAFTIDYFPIIFQHFTNQQDRVAQENILLQIIPEEEIESALLSAERLAMEEIGTGKRRFLRDPVASFVGRKAEEARLVASLRIALHGPKVGIGGIRGLGGVGKTALAFKVAASLRDTFPLQILIELRGQSGRPLSSKEALGAVLHALRPSARLPDDLREMERRYHEALCGQPALMLADDAADAEQIKLLLPPPAGSALLITTRHRFSLPDLQRDDMLDLDKLPRPQAIALLNGQCSRLRNTLPNQVNRLAHACGDLGLVSKQLD